MTNMEHIDYMLKSKEELIDIIKQYEDDMQRLKNKADYARTLEEDRRKTEEVLKRYCGDSVNGPIPTIVGVIIDDYLYQRDETEHQVKELQKAEKTIAVQKERIIELKEKADKLEKRLWDPEWCRLIDKLNEMIDKEAPIPYQLRKVYTNVEDEIWGKLNYLTRSLCLRNNLIREKNKNIRRLENKVNELDVMSRRLKLENEKLILAQGDNAIEHATEITELKEEISALKTELDVLRTKNNEYSRVAHDALDAGYEAANTIRHLEEENSRLNNDVNKLRGENRMLKYSQPWMYGMSSKEATNRIFGVNGTIHKLREENDKLKDALEFCQKEASSARAHAHNIEFNAERIRKGLD